MVFDVDFCLFLFSNLRGEYEERIGQLEKQSLQLLKRCETSDENTQKNVAISLETNKMQKQRIQELTNRKQFVLLFETTNFLL